MFSSNISRYDKVHTSEHKYSISVNMVLSRIGLYVITISILHIIRMILIDFIVLLNKFILLGIYSTVN